MEEVQQPMSEVHENMDLSLVGDKPSENQEGAEVKDPASEIVDFNTLSVEQIVEKFKFEKIPKEDFQPDFSNVILHNKYHKFYYAKSEKLGPLSIIVLNEVDKQKISFANILTKLSQLQDIDCQSILKLKGVCILETQVYLIFEYLNSSYKKMATEINNANNVNLKFLTMFYLIEMIYLCHEKSIPIKEIRTSNLLLNSHENLRFLLAIDEFLGFKQSHENKTERVEEEFKFDRYRPPEVIIDQKFDMLTDIWTVGCLFVELFSSSEVWSGLTEEEMIRDLKKYYVPKIHKDIPKHMWGIICECLNPFLETRISAKELLDRYVRLLQKLNIAEITVLIQKYIVDGDVSKLNATSLDGGDPKAIRKCPLHPKHEASTFCAQCCDIICDQCKRTAHIEHSEKGVFFEYLDFINLARSRIHSYKEKFAKYIVDANVPQREIYDEKLKTNSDHIEELYNNQKAKIEEQFTYLATILEQLKTLEIEHLTKNRDFFKNLFQNILDNYSNMQKEIESVHTIVEEKEEIFLKFQDLDQSEKEKTMKLVTPSENELNFKKKTIIKCVANFYKDYNLIERLKRYFEMFIEKYKENKINDLVKVVEKKNETISKKYQEIDLNEYLKILVYEFEQISLLSSRNYFNSSTRELFISIVNTNKIFSYNLDADKYFITEVDFKTMPINRFPNYSRSLIINGNLLVNGGYDEEHKVTLPYFFFYDRMNKTLTRLNDMLYGHSAHSIIYIPMHYIVVVSGSGILKCEKYDMETNAWTELPDINVPRQNCTLYYYNKQYLYAFGGAYWDDTKKSFIYVESIERLDLGFGTVQGAQTWEPLQTYKLGKEFNLKKSVMSVLSYTANKILLVGGSVNYNTYSDESIQFDFEKNEFSLKEGIILPKKTCFPNKTFMYSGDKAYQLDNDGNVFEYDFTSGKFNIIKENTVLKSSKSNI